MFCCFLCVGYETDYSLPDISHIQLSTYNTSEGICGGEINGTNVNYNTNLVICDDNVECIGDIIDLTDNNATKIYDLMNSSTASVCCIGSNTCRSAAITTVAKSRYAVRCDGM